MLLVLRLELRKLLAQRGTYAGLGVLMILVGLFAWGIKHEGSPQEFAHSMQDLVIGGKLRTAANLAYILLAFPLAIDVLIPMLVATTSGGLVASEARAGTLRYQLIRPVSRFQLLTGKLLAGWLHAMALTLFLGLFSLAVGYLVFGGGDLLATRVGVTIFPEGRALVRLLDAYLLAGAAMCAVASIALMLSVICDNPLTAAGLTVAFFLVSIGLKPFSFFDWLTPHLLTSHLEVYQQAFARSIPWDKVLREGWYLAGYALVPYLIAATVFHRKDMTC